MSFPLKLLAVNAAMYIIGSFVPVFSAFARTWVWLAVLVFYFGLTWLLNRWIQSAMRRSSIQFITAVNGSTAIKMFTSLGLVTSYLVLVGGDYRVHFVLGLFVVFAVNTVLLVMQSQTTKIESEN